jgi:hypothetical protein
LTGAKEAGFAAEKAPKPVEVDDDKEEKAEADLGGVVVLCPNAD